MLVITTKEQKKSMVLYATAENYVFFTATILRNWLQYKSVVK
jgi:hypothetical protein